jgi:hypothetical protein
MSETLTIILPDRGKATKDGAKPRFIEKSPLAIEQPAGVKPVMGM